MIDPQRFVGASEAVLRAPARGRSSRGYYRRLGVAAALAALFAALAVLMAVGPAWAAAPPTGEAGVSISTAPAGTIAGSVDAGGNHSCGVKTDGTLACWGDNGSGQLGAAPAAPSPDPPAGQVGTAYSHSFTGSPSGSFSVSAGDLPPGLDLSGAGVLSGTPTAGGEYIFTVTASNGLFADASEEFTVTITVTPVNDAPTIKVLAGSASQSACLSGTRGRITLKLADVDNNVSALTLSVLSSSNTRLVPKSNVSFSGSTETRTATITTVSGRTGSSSVTLKVSDSQASASTPVTVRAGGNDEDTLTGTSGADLLLGRDDGDLLRGFGGSDVLCGAKGADRLTGGGGADSFDGGSGTDTAPDFNATEGDSKTNIP